MFQNLKIKRVPRKVNTEAHTLANLGSAFKIHPDIKIPISYVIKPTIKHVKDEVVPIKDLGSKDLNPKESWIQPIFQYL